MKIVAAVLSYKMRELTNKTVGQLVKGGFTLNKDLFIFENQAQPEVSTWRERPSLWDHSKYVTHFTGSNLRMTNGFNYICDTIAGWQEQPDALWLCTNDFDILQTRVFYDEKPLPELIEQAFDLQAGKLGWWHPALEPIPGYAYPWMFDQNIGQRKTWMTDFICPAVNWQAMKEIKSQHGFWFEPRFYRGWGIDYETCYLMRRQGLRVHVDDTMVIRHEASKTYTSGNAPESKDAFYDRALAEMRAVMQEKYGPGWHEMMME